MNVFKKAITFLMALSITSTNFAMAQQHSMGAEDLVSRSTALITQLNGGGTEFLDTNGQGLNPSAAIRTRDFYMKNSDSNLYFRARLSSNNGVTTIALGAYDSVGGNRLAARTVMVDPTKSHAENNLLIDQTIQSLGQQVEKFASNDKAPKQARSIAQQKIALPFISMIKMLVGIGFLFAAIDVVFDWESMKGKKLLKAGGAAVALALGYVILDRYFVDAQ